MKRYVKEFAKDFIKGYEDTTRYEEIRIRVNAISRLYYSGIITSTEAVQAILDVR